MPVLSGKSVELYPQAIQAYRKSGHEICAHAYTQEQILPYPARAAAVNSGLHKANCGCDRGEAPWLGKPTGDPNTIHDEFLAEEGYLWQGDFNNADMPYILETSKGQLAALMHSDFSDVRVVRSNPQDYFTVHRDMFDFLYRSGKPEIVNLTVHTL